MVAASRGPLAGLAVLELASGIAGPYAGRLFAMLGADVVKVEPAGGDVARRLRIDDLDDTGGGTAVSPAFVHLNAGKRLVRAGGVDLADAVAWADVVLDDRVARDLGGSPLHPDALRRSHARVVLASITAWGFDATDGGDPRDELIVQAASGLMSETGDPGREPLRFPGWQSQYLAGGYAAATALASVHREGVTHVDVSWVASALTGVEGGVCAYLQPATRVRTSEPATPDDDEARSARQAGFQVGAFPSGAFACADGYVVPGTVRAIDWDLQCKVYERPDLLDDERFSWRMRWTNRDALRAELQPWYDAHTKREIFRAALDAGWAAAMVMTAGDALDDEHLASRSFLSPVTGAAKATIAGRPWRSASIVEGEPVELAATQPRLSLSLPRASAPVGVAPSDLKVLELTWAWAGPFVGRFLGALGADVVRVEAGRYPDGWRTRLRWRDADVEPPDGVDPDGYTWDAAALFNSLNRNKRGVSVDLTTDAGRSVFLDLLSEADVMVANMTYSVLADRGIEDEVEAAVERGLVFANMPALGATGPYRDMPGYGMLMEGMGGFSARFGYLDEGARASATYYPDAIAGLHGSVAVLAALAERERTGRGAKVDLSQQETTWLQFGEGLALRSMHGREPQRLGNAEPGVSPSGVYPTRDGFVALVVRGDAAFAELCERVPALSPLRDLDLAARLARRSAVDAAIEGWTQSATTDDTINALGGIDGVRAVRCETFRSAFRSGRLEARGQIDTIEHPLTGTRGYLALPLRIDGARLGSRRPAPVFAQHTDEVLAEWAGYDAARINALRAANAVGTVPTAAPRR